MGIPVEIEPFGDECPYWPDPAETPESIYCLFYDVKKGNKPGAVDVPNGHIFHVYQKEFNACSWELWNPATDWLIQVVLQADVSSVILGDDPLNPNLYFWGRWGPSPLVEYGLYDNFYELELMTYGYGGHCMLFWLTAGSWTAIKFGLDHADDLMLEVFPVDDDYYVVKLCSIRWGTNISFKIAR